MERLKVRLTQTFLVGLLIFMTASCKHEKQRITIGYLPITASLPLFVAKEKGFFESEGLTVEIKKMESANEVMNALLSGQIDVADGIGFSTYIPIEAKSPGQFKLFITGVETDKKFTASLLVRKDSKIDSVADLKGKIVGTYTGLTQLLNLKLVLRHFLNPDKDVTIKQVETNLQVSALQSGEFDALFTIDPYTTIAKENGIGVPLIDNPRVKYIVSPFPTFANAVSEKFLKADVDEVKKLNNAFNKALDYIQQNNSDAKKLLTKYTPLKENIATKCGDYEMQRLGQQDNQSLQKFADILYENKVISTKVNAASMYISNLK